VHKQKLKKQMLPLENDNTLKDKTCKMYLVLVLKNHTVKTQNNFKTNLNLIYYLIMLYHVGILRDFIQVYTFSGEYLAI